VYYIVSEYPGQDVNLWVLSNFSIHVSNEETLVVTPVSMWKVISVSTCLSRFYCILKGIAVMNMITPGSDIVMRVYFPCVYVE
jgi:hypothetical protein